MTPKGIMVIAGEPSGDVMAAELVRELRVRLEQRPTYSNDLQPLQADLAPRFFGAGGPRMAEAGVELAFDLTSHAVVGLPGLKRYLQLRRLFNQLIQVATDRQPDAIILVDFSVFNHRFAHSIRRIVRAHRGPFFDWNPKLIKYVSPQVWASREGRAWQMAEDFDLVLSIFPFEKDWYTARVPKLRVEFVGHPMLDRYRSVECGVRNSELKATPSPAAPLVVLLPGSRKGELVRHLPVMFQAMKIIQSSILSIRATVVLPTEDLAQMVRPLSPAGVTVQVGGLAEALGGATIAIACTGTVTMECAFFGVPAVTLYKTSWWTYQIGKRLVKINSLTMPNLLAKEEIFPEFIQDAATPTNLFRVALELLHDEPRRSRVKAKLAKIVASLGGPGASRRAAEAISSII